MSESAITNPTDKRKKWLSQTDTTRLLEVAKKHSIRDWLILELARYGLRDGEILGRGRLPGIKAGDLRSNGVWLTGKGYSQDPPELYGLPIEMCQELERFRVSAKTGSKEKLFGISVRRLEQVIKNYAREAGIEDWELVKPHRLRAFYATDLDDREQSAFTIRRLMRHKNYATTDRYIGEKVSPTRRNRIMESLTVPLPEN